jgi:hypothetical protein
MKFRRLALIPLALLMVSAAPAAAPASAPEDSLSMAAARDATRRTAGDVARRNSLVNTVKVQSCRRRTAKRIVCLAIDQGSTSIQRTTCKVWVRVDLADGRPQASLRSVKCDNEQLLLLRGAPARAALEAAALKLGAENPAIDPVRLSRLEILGLVGWLRPVDSDPSQTEICSVQMRARLSVSGEVTVQADEVRCTVPPA